MPYVYTNPHKQSLLVAQQELADRRQQLQWLQERIQSLERTINALTPLAEDGQQEDVGLANFCLQILASVNGPLTAVQVRDILLLKGVDLNSYANGMAVLHTTLKRLVASGDAGSVNGQYVIRTAGKLRVQYGAIS
jgi:hypothetical protein